jgi:hypothetical protein
MTWFSSQQVFPASRDGYRARRQWDLLTPCVGNTRRNRVRPSPILYGDYLYLTSDRGGLTCSTPNGEVKYKETVPSAASFTASQLHSMEKILLTMKTAIRIVKAGPKHEILGTNSVGEPCMRHLRRGRKLLSAVTKSYCIGS